MEEQDLDVLKLKLQILERLYKDPKDRINVISMALDEQIALASSFTKIRTHIAPDDPVYRFDATEAEFLALLRDPVALLATKGIFTLTSDLIVIGRYGVVPSGMFARVYGVPGTQIVTATVKHDAQIPTPLALLSAEGVTFDYINDAAGALTNRVFFHQQIVNNSRKEKDAYGQWIPESLQITRNEAATLAMDVIKAPVSYLGKVPQRDPAGNTAIKKYSRVSWNSTTPPARRDLTAPVRWLSTTGTNAISRGFVIQLPSESAMMCAVAEMENKHMGDPPETGVQQQFLAEQIIIKCY